MDTMASLFHATCCCECLQGYLHEGHLSLVDEAKWVLLVRASGIGRNQCSWLPDDNQDPAS